MASSAYRLIATIDFGTSTTARGYAFPSSKAADKTLIGIKWPDQTIKGRTAILLDCITKEVIAYGEDAWVRHQEEFATMKQSERRPNLYFTNFKMVLYDAQQQQQNKDDNKEGSTGGILVTAACGQSMLLFDLLVIVYRYLGQSILTAANEATTQRLKWETDLHQVKWILTVPNIWNDTTKAFIRQAWLATKLSESCDVQLAIESECAAIGARKEDASLSSKGMSVGTHYIVADGGGGTFDISAHTVVADAQSVAETCESSGGPYGATCIDQDFVQFLQDVFGIECINTFCQTRRAAWQDWINAFQKWRTTTRAPIDLNKVEFSIKAGYEASDTAVTTFLNHLSSSSSPHVRRFNVPQAFIRHLHPRTLDECCKAFSRKHERVDYVVSASGSGGTTSTAPEQNAVLHSGSVNLLIRNDYVSTSATPATKTEKDTAVKAIDVLTADQDNDALVLQPKLVYAFYRRSLIGMTTELDKIVQHAVQAGKRPDILFLVGGYPASEVLYHFVCSRYRKSMMIVRPPSPELAIYVGALLFGFNPNYLVSRVMRLNYGLLTAFPFDERLHASDDATMLEVMYGGRLTKLVIDRWSTLVNKGEHVPLGKTVTCARFPSYDAQAVVALEIGVSALAHVTESGPKPRDYRCIGHVRVRLPPMPHVLADRRHISIVFNFSGTELDVTATDVLTNETVNASLQYLD